MGPDAKDREAGLESPDLAISQLHLVVAQAAEAAWRRRRMAKAVIERARPATPRGVARSDGVKPPVTSAAELLVTWKVALAGLPATGAPLAVYWVTMMVW